ncbi:unnamed protein product [Oppiella nova]|uniref:Uncharacterized protein n=1 Tax=Oppiella nova TaxID=334625 RepID=A0A7R9LDS2_9ACAR|nr:unnamed protein product [Oppiella nova]CAG2162640.1 unnamed protein product [Oppiella nova]
MPANECPFDDSFEFCVRRANGSTDCHFEYVLGLTHLMQKLVQIEDNVVDLWIKSSKQSRNCLLTAIFRFIPNCGLEVCSPKVVDLCPIDHKIRMSFYEFLCFSVCQLMMTLSANQMPFVEQTLFENLLSEDCIRHQLASDVLCFISRFNESSALCYHFCSLLMTMSSHIDHRLVPNTTSLLNRLLPFLKPSELQYLISDYDLIKHSKTWSLLNVSLVLSPQEITKTVDRYQTFIAEGRPLTTHDLNLMSNLLTTHAVDDKTRENTFITILDNFSQSNDCKLNIHFIDLLTVLTPKRFNDLNRNQLMDKNVIKTYLQNTIALEVKPRRYGRSDDNSSPMNAKNKNKKRRKIVDESDEDFDDSLDFMVEAMEEGFNGADTQ